MKLGKIEASHAIPVTYQKWGKEGSLLIKDVSKQVLDRVREKLEKLIPLSAWKLVSADTVSYYQGEQLAETEALLLRYQRASTDKIALTGEHISLCYDLNNERLLGYQKMVLPSAITTGTDLVSHQVAFETAITFLLQSSPDLNITYDQEITMTKTDVSNVLRFSPELNLGDIELHWIGPHKEVLYDSGKKAVEVVGMKVKCYLPKIKLWAWVIVDKNNRVQTFERNVSWDFIKLQRKSQMWLHDQWLLENKLALCQL